MDERLKKVEDLLLNIENLNKQEKNQLLSLIKGYYINSSDEYMVLYNKLNDSQLGKLKELVGIKALDQKFFLGIRNIEPFIVPYNVSSMFLYKSILQDEKLASIVLNNDTFYLKLSRFDMGDIVKDLPTTNLKNQFIDHCIKLYFNEIIHEISSPISQISGYISDEKIIELMKNQDDSNIVLKLYAKLSDNNKIITYNSDWFRNKVDINNFLTRNEIIQNSPEEVILDFLDTISLHLALVNFRDTKKAIFLKLLIDKLEDNTLLDDFEFGLLMEQLFIISGKKFLELGNYVDKLIEFINNLDESLYCQKYFERYMTYEYQSKELSEVMYNKLKNSLENGHGKIEKLSPKIIISNDSKLLDLVIQYIEKSDLLLLAIRNTYINDKVLNILKDNPDYFENVVVNNPDKYKMPKFDINDPIISKYMQLANYLNKEQLSIYFIPFYIDNNNDIKNYYIEQVKSNYNTLASLKDLSLFSDDMMNKILMNISFEKLMDLVLYHPFKLDENVTKNLRNNMDNRMYELAQFVNDNENETYLNLSHRSHIILQIVNANKKEILIENINNKNILGHMILDVRGVDYELIIEHLAKLYNNDIEIQTMNFLPMFFEENKERDFFEKLSFESIVNMACNECKFNDKNSKKFKTYVKYIMDKIDDNINCLFSLNVITKLDELFLYLPSDYTDKIEKYIDDEYNSLKDKYPKLQQYINTYTDKANYISGINNSMINDNTYDYILELCDKNKFLFNSMDFRLLDPDIMKMGNYFIDKTSRYPIIASKLLKLYTDNIDKYNILVLLSQKIRLENNDSIYDQKIEIFINYLLGHDITVSLPLTPALLTNIENYILDQSINNDTKFINLDITNYKSARNNILEQYIYSANEIDSLKDYVYQRYFGLHPDKIDEFLVSYVYNWDSVIDYCDDIFVNQYIKDISIIKNINDINALRNVINNMKQYTISDFMKVKSIMINTYSKSISRDIENNNNAIKKVRIGDKQVEAEELENEFGIFVHSTDAYGSMPLINDDYYDSWNYNPNTKNHGICASYITNSSYGTAAVKNQGVMFGFTKFDENGISLMAPYDLATVNDGYNIRSRHKPFFGTLKTISDYTRHTHNETTIERRIFQTDGKSYLRQPDCIIIFEDMSEEVKQNSLKAYEDFLSHGIELKIKYIDRVKNAKREASKLELLISKYEQSFDLNILANIINLYESNICSCDYLGKGKPESIELFDQHELFKTDKIKSILLETIDYIYNIDDQELRKSTLDKLCNILDMEQYKFDLIDDLNKNRKHIFDLYDENLKTQINKLKNMNSALKK